MQLHSILINDTGTADTCELPAPAQANVASLQRLYPTLPHKLWGETALHEFLHQHFPREVGQCFARLKPYAYKADLAKYCVLHVYGGVYADLSYHLLRPLPLDPTRVVVFRDFLWTASWDTSNGLFAAPAQHPALACAIERVCRHVQDNYYGPTSLCPTGPALFGQALAMTCEPDDVITGAAILQDRQLVRRLAPTARLPDQRQLHCLMLNHEIVAVKTKRMASPGLTDLGVTNGNAYFELWQRRDIYHPAQDAAGNAAPPNPHPVDPTWTPEQPLVSPELMGKLPTFSENPLRRLTRWLTQR